MRKLLCYVLLGLAGASAQAQELVFSSEATRQCMAAAKDPAAREACVGASASACMADTTGGSSTVGMLGCFDRELKLWDTRLNAAFRDLLSVNEATDAEMEEIGATVPSLSDALRNMQRAWIDYRDAACAYEGAHWGNGTGSGPATLDCLMRETAEQALRLEDRLQSYEDR